MLPDNSQALFRKRKRHPKSESIVKDATDSTTAVLPWHQDESRKTKRRLRREAEKEQRLERKGRKLKTESRGHSKTKKQTIAYPKTAVKARYRIDVLASVYLDEIAKVHGPHGVMKIPPKAVPGLGFYQGVRLAHDSLRKSGAAIDLYLHDIASRRECIDSLLNREKLDSSDLVIAALAPADLPRIASYCQKHQINCVSALSPADGGIRGNKFLTIAQPVLRTHCEFLVNYMANYFADRKVLWLYRNNNTADANAYGYLNTATEGTIQKLICNSLPKPEELRRFIGAAPEQTVLIPVIDVVFADSLLRQLNATFPNTRFDVVGMPSWSGLNLQKRAPDYPGMSFYVPAPFQFDPSSPAVRNCEKKYKSAFSGTADEYVFRGYETVLWYSQLLSSFGTIFNNDYLDGGEALFTLFHVQPSYDSHGQFLYDENKNIYMLHYVSEPGR